MYANNYAGCGCTSLADYASPRFVPAPAYGAEATDEKPWTTGRKALLILGGFAALYAIHRASGGYAPPPPYRASQGTTKPRKYHLPR
jgi:hypothetical protein